MLMRLSKNTFVRFYGPYTYIRNRYGNQDFMFKNSDCFFKHIGRIVREESEIISSIVSEFSDVDAKIIKSDFSTLITPLVRMGLIVCGNTIDEVDQADCNFSYKSAKEVSIGRDAVIAEDEYSEMPQCVLGNYFREHPTLFDLQLDITQACTERCVHCYVPEFNPLFLPYNKCRDVVDEFRDMGGLMLGISGGECMLHPDFKKIVAYAREKDLIVSILSNLTLCDDEMVNFLKDQQTFVQVSLYSMNPKVHDCITQRNGSWVKTKAAIEKLHDEDVPVRISCPTMRQNFKEYLDVLKYAESLDIPAQTDFIMMAKSNHDTSNLNNRLTLDQTKSLLEMIIGDELPVESEYFDPKHKSNLKTPEERAEEPLCGAGVDKLCLNANGNYYPCSGFQDYSVGNCFNQDLRDVWDNSPQLKYIRGLRGKDIPKCVHCDNRNYCSMCLVRNFNETGDMLKVADHFCKVAELNKEVVNAYHQRIINKCHKEKYDL